MTTNYKRPPQQVQFLLSTPTGKVDLIQPFDQLHGDIFTRFTFPSGDIHVRMNEDLMARIQQTCKDVAQGTTLLCDIVVIGDLRDANDVMMTSLIIDGIYKFLWHVNSQNVLNPNVMVEIDVNVTCVFSYVEYLRQDRVAYKGDCVSSEIMRSMINTLSDRFNANVAIIDPHDTKDISGGASGIYTAKAIYDLMRTVMNANQSTDLCIILPDEGANTRMRTIVESQAINAGVTNLEFLIGSKVRDPKTGELSRFTLITPEGEVPVFDTDVNYLVVDDIGDDIGDGMGTFALLREAIPSEIQVKLAVTHGLFTRGPYFLDSFSQVFTLQTQFVAENDINRVVFNWKQITHSDFN